ncbi:MAG: type II toxin-antitoxin system RelE/ParE family toxin [Acidobacteriaceae bacterium]
MMVRSFSHKPLRRFYEAGATKGLPPDSIARLRAMFAVLDRMKDAEELKFWPLWKLHKLTGNRKSRWSLHVTRNWRLTFRIEDDEIVDLNLEDYR